MFELTMVEEGENDRKSPGGAPFNAADLETLGEQAKLAVILLHAVRSGVVVGQAEGGRVPVRCVSKSE